MDGLIEGLFELGVGVFEAIAEAISGASGEAVGQTVSDVLSGVNHLPAIGGSTEEEG